MVPLHEGPLAAQPRETVSPVQPAVRASFVSTPDPSIYQQDQSSLWAIAANGTYNPVGSIAATGEPDATPLAYGPASPTSLWDQLRATLAQSTVPGAPATRVPYINQYRPAGREYGYTNGNANCGPTSMAMVARAFGYGGNLSDAQLINYLGGVGRTGASGTSVNGIAAMAQTMGLSAEIRGSGPDTAWIAEQLATGKYVVANGDYYAMAPHANSNRTSGHYVLITGRDAYGRFLVQDPADPDARVVDDRELAHYIRSNTNGGFQVAVG
jgi:hypothetical protein